MYLKKIIIAGFKSFADKVVLNLDRGITGIVGPNGAGKSNIIDAVRWVMGEQNAKNLRGEKATDIIFAGSERRKALGMAEVSLVFDNTDDDAFCPPEYRHEPEISLTRRLYADGQREYLINRKPCRLKDIISFFATTGLGGRSYSMIQQGQVDRILNAKPEDVREILEEAAGTTVYKKRKGEAERKLEQTNLNLSRIEDILSEVEKQLQALEGQVEKAKEYQELSGRLRDEEVSLLAHNFRHFRDMQAKLLGGLDAELASEAQTLAEISGLDSRHAELQGQMDDADPDIQALQEKISVIRETLARSESTLKSATQRLDSGIRRQATIGVELAEDDANLKALEAQADASRQEVAQAEAVGRQLAEAIETFEYEVEAAQEAAQVYESRMEEHQEELTNLERLIESNKFRSEQLDKDLERARRGAAEEEARVATLTAELALGATDLAEAEARAGATQAGLDHEIREKHDREAAVARRYHQIKDANVRRDLLKERYHASRGRYTSLAELDAGATDVAAALAKLKAEAPAAARLCRGLLTDFIGFGATAQELPPKAAAALERWAERVVVDDLAAFNDLVRAAQREDLGTLPVVVLAEAEAVDRAAMAAWAADCGAEPLRQYLKVDEALAGVGTVVDRLYLLPALELGQAEVRSLPRGGVVFTSQGVSFHGADELVVGGKVAPGLLSRKTELERLAADLKVIEGELARAQAEIDDLDFKINADRQVVAEIDAKLQQQNRGVLEVMQALQAVQQVVDRKQELIDAAGAAAARLRADEARMADERETLTKSRFSLSREHGNTKAEHATLMEESESLVDRKEELRRMHEAKRIEQAKASTRVQMQRDAARNSQAQLELLQHKLSRRYEERTRLDTDLETAKRERAQAEADIERFVREREQLQEEFAVRREAHAGVMEELRVIDRRLRDLRETGAALQKRLADKNIRLEQARMALAGVVDQAVEKYKLDLTTHAFEVDPEFNQDGRSRAVARLRNRLEGMGAINMMALKEFEEKAARRDFITRQRDEVVSSIELLAVAIAEIEETSLRKFLDIFARINAEFAQLFPILFPTGEGKLELTHPDTPMEGGVEILCRLPGKSQKSMSLFSGGEKALTAMALIFALLRTKPTPYCFLDEVDAPLDEANVGRYNRVLEALAGQFQFIVITHNRRTMEVLDVLFGITMQEPGVSKIVGVDMEKDLPQHLRKAFKEAGAGALPPVAGSRPLAGASAG